MSDEDKPPPAGYEWWVIDGKRQLVAISQRVNAKLLRQETIASGLAQAAAENARLRAELEQARKPTPEQVYERWHRARGQNPKITLRQICEMLDVNYDSIRAARARATKHKKRK